MRFPSLPTLVRTFYTFSNLTAVNFARNTAFVRQTINSNPAFTNPLLLNRTIVLKSMPTIPFLSSLFSTSAKNRDNMSYPMKKSDDEWRAVLSPEQFRVIRESGTEAPYSGEYDKHYPSQGVYACAACNKPLYTADTKFKSGCGWPAFYDTVPGAVERIEDRAFGMARTEIRCANCGGHLGHVFKGEGYKNPTDERHCVNSVSLKFNNEEGGAEKK